MVSTKWLSWLKGNDKEIIEMLDKQSDNLVNATTSLVKIIPESRKGVLMKIKYHKSRIWNTKVII